MDIKLCYIWVKKFRNFENAGFNFKHDVKFNYKSENSHIDIESLSPLPKDFFGYSNIEVAGLIGRNGSGKSNVLELVCLLLKGGQSNVNSDFLIICEQNNSFVSYLNFNSRELLSRNPGIQFIPYPKKIDPLKIVYFSNVFDGRVHGFDKDVSDISNNFRYPRERYPYSLTRKKSDLEKQMELIDSDLFNILNIETPTELRITSKILNKRFSTNPRSNQYEKIFNLEVLKQFLSRRFQDINNNRKLYYLATLSLFIQTLKVFDRLDNDAQRFKQLLDDLKQIESDYNTKGSKTETLMENILEWINKVIDYILHDGRKIRGIERIERDFNTLIKFYAKFKNLNIDLVSEGRWSKKKELFIIQYNSIQKREFSGLVSLFSNSDFDINWMGISSGHKAYLNIFSLLHAELRNIRRENALICIDEGDLYLHPQWQIEFFDKLLAFVQKIYSGNIQFILTSHSPFLLSDLPKQNVTIIDENSQHGGINGVTLEKETFAGNLYSLYAEPFFLGSNRTSIFAQKKIQRLIEALDIDTTGLTNTQKARFLKEINLIGDDVIRLHLLKKFKK